MCLAGFAPVNSTAHFLTELARLRVRNHSPDLWNLATAAVHDVPNPTVRVPIRTV